MDRTLDVNINGFKTCLQFSKSDEDQVIMPVLEEIQRRDAKIVFLAGPPGTGKSTFAAVLEEYAGRQGMNLQALGMDGFHFTNAKLKTLGLLESKGSPETFDILALQKALSEKKKWPSYSRLKHDPDGVIDITADILLVEGNYLLLQEPKWEELACDLSIWIEEEPEILVNRLINRKIRGGMSKAEAEEWVHKSDEKNIRRVFSHSKKADMTVSVPNWKR